MKAIRFPEANLAVGEKQKEYETIYCFSNPLQYGHPVTSCFEFSEEEKAQIARTGKFFFNTANIRATLQSHFLKCIGSVYRLPGRPSNIYANRC